MIANKFIIFGTIAALITMSMTSYYGLANGLDILISQDDVFTYLRIGLIPALLILLFSEVPRSMATRMFIGVISVLLMGTSGFYLMSDQLYVLDGMMFALIAVVLALEALEVSPDADLQKLPPAKIHPVPAVTN